MTTNYLSKHVEAYYTRLYSVNKSIAKATNTETARNLLRLLLFRCVRLKVYCVVLFLLKLFMRCGNELLSQLVGDDVHMAMLYCYTDAFVFEFCFCGRCCASRSVCCCV